MFNVDFLHHGRYLWLCYFFQFYMQTLHSSNCIVISVIESLRVRSRYIVGSYIQYRESSAEDSPDVIIYFIKM